MSKKVSVNSIKFEFDKLLDLLVCGLEDCDGTLSARAAEKGITLKVFLSQLLEQEFSTRIKSANLLLARSSTAISKGQELSQITGEESLEQLGQMTTQLGKCCDSASNALERSSVLSIQASLLRNVLVSYLEGNTSEALTIIDGYKKREEKKQKEKEIKKNPSDSLISEEIIL